MKFVVLLVVLAIVAPFAAAQGSFPGEYDPSTAYGITSKCEAYSGTPQTCQDFVDPNIWVPTNYSQAKIQQEISDYATIDTILAAVPSPSCKAQFAKLLCGTAFRRCQTNTLEFNATYSLNITVGLPVCKSVCVAAVDGCRPYFEAAGYAQYLPNCSYEVSGYPVWPEVSLQVSVYGQNLTLNCYVPPGPDSLCIDAGLVTVCAGSALSSPFYYFSSLLAELSVFEFLSSALGPFSSLFDFRLF